VERRCSKWSLRFWASHAKMKYEVRLCIGKKDASGLQTTAESCIRIRQTSSQLDIVSRDPWAWYSRVLKHLVLFVARSKSKFHQRWSERK
jgi:hypothetical protein